MLVRIDLAPGDNVTDPSEARLMLAADDTNTIPARFIDFAPTMEQQLQGRGMFFLAENPDKRLVPGLALTAFLKTSGAVRPGVVVPPEAVVRAEGESWIYVQTGEGAFQRTQIRPERHLEGGWFVGEGLKPQQPVVIVGAQQLLSEELKGQLEE